LPAPFIFNLCLWKKPARRLLAAPQTPSAGNHVTVSERPRHRPDGLQQSTTLTRRFLLDSARWTYLPRHPPTLHQIPIGNCQLAPSSWSHGRLLRAERTTSHSRLFFLRASTHENPNLFGNGVTYTTRAGLRQRPASRSWV
jgi:hypothetical protein